MTPEKKKKIYEAVRTVIDLVTWGNDVEVDVGKPFENVVDEELISVIEAIGLKNEPVSKDSEGAARHYLLRELIDKDVSLEAAASILWQWKIWEDAKEEERDGIERDAGPDAQAHLHRVSESHRLQLEHYLIVGRISQDLINRLIRPDKLKIES